MNSISRRAFLNRAISSAALAAAPGIVRIAAAAPNDRISLAVIGLHNRGPQVAEACIKSGQFDIRCLCDCDEAMFDKGAKALGAKLTGNPKREKDFRRVLDDKEIDAVIIATPDHWHAMMAVMALQAGKHVYLEKPASYCVRDGQAMVAAAEKTPKVTLAVGTQQRSGRHFQEAREFIRSGALGKVGFCRAWVTNNRKPIPIVPDSAPPGSLNYDMWLGPAPQRPYNENRVHYNWRFIKDYGTGEMGNWGAHWLDIIVWSLGLGLPVSTTGTGGMYVFSDTKEWPDTQTVLYEYPKLTVLWEQRIWTGFDLNGEGTGAEFDGEKGSLVISRKGWHFHPKGGKTESHEGSEMETAHTHNFAEAIRGSAKVAASIADAHLSATLCHLGNISVALNRKVAFDAATQRCVNDPDADRLLSREYRSPWKLG